MQNQIKTLARKALIKTGLKNPTTPWLTYPMTVQIDTTNLCGPTKEGSSIYCEYCWPQNAILEGIMKQAEMPMEQIEWIQRDIAMNMPHLTKRRDPQPLQFIAYFLNGDPQNELRLPEILETHDKLLNWLPTQIFTSATKTNRMQLFCNPRLDNVCVTLSAPNPTIYKLVHRGDKFNQVIESMEYITKHAWSTQRLEVHYVVTQNNIPYIKEWWDMIGKEFPTWKRVVSPLVKSATNYPSVKAMGTLTLEQQETAIKKAVGENYFWDHTSTGIGQPCVLWNNFAITAQGFLLQCCNWDNPLNWNYGTLQDCMKEDISLKEIWALRIANKQHNSLCDSCNLKHPEAKQRLRTIKIKCSI